MGKKPGQSYHSEMQCPNSCCPGRLHQNCNRPFSRLAPIPNPFPSGKAALGEGAFTGR